MLPFLEKIYPDSRSTFKLKNNQVFRCARDIDFIKERRFYINFFKLKHTYTIDVLIMEKIDSA